ncbi:hypothetical protein V8C86DRAFT_2555270 [Haematococcus lacustris]
MADSLTFTSLQRFLRSEYYALNTCFIGTYYLFRRAHVGSIVELKTPVDLWKGEFTTLHSAEFRGLEAQVAATLVVTAIFRSYRSTSLDASLATILGFSQLFVIIMSCLVDGAAGLHYLAAFALVFLLVNEPTYTGPSKVDTLTPQTFQEACTSSAAAASGVACVVYLHAPWHARCRHACGLFAELSNRYATDKLRFGQLDVGCWPRIARQLDIELSSVSNQLPTIAMWEGGEERGRVPTSSAGRRRQRSAKWGITKLDIINALELDVRYANSMSSTTGSASQHDQAGESKKAA